MGIKMEVYAISGSSERGNRACIGWLEWWFWGEWRVVNEAINEFK